VFFVILNEKIGKFMSCLAIFGVANERSLAWSCLRQTESLYEKIYLGVLDERTEKKVTRLLEENSSLFKKTQIVQCDVAEKVNIDQFFQRMPAQSLTGLIHAVAFTDRECLTKPFSEVTKEQFDQTLNVSCLSFIQIMQAAKLKFEKKASSVCLSYLGSERVIPNYNIMGVAKAALESATRYLSAEFGVHQVRVNTISAGPVKTLASSAIKDFKQMLVHTEQTSPLRRNITADEVGATTRFLLSTASSGITGTTIYVDAGTHVTIGLPS
jgi:enoyl-[acyl-carrier protein] reductase I